LSLPDEKELSISQEDEDEPDEFTNGELQDDDAEETLPDLNKSQEVSQSLFIKTKSSPAKFEPETNDVTNEAKSPTFAQSFNTSNSLVYKNSRKSMSPSKAYEYETNKDSTPKRTSLIEKLSQVYSPAKKEARILNPSEIKMLGMSNELRKSLLRQNGYDEGGPINPFGSPELAAKKQKDMIKSE
jgi:hypothetical protein